MIDIFCENNEYLTCVKEIADRLDCKVLSEKPECEHLYFDSDGLWFVSDGMKIQGDFDKLGKRVSPHSLGSEMLVRACRGRGECEGLSAVDATAGLGEDSFLLAAAGYSVTLFEYNPIVYELLLDAIRRGQNSAGVGHIVKRMTLCPGNSIELLPELDFTPDVIFLDPMFPERSKSGAVKKKFQLIHQIERPCDAEEELLTAAISAHPKKIVIKRPAKGPNLAGKTPSYSIKGDAIRYDCILPKA